ncbi:MAG: bifunctional tRNA (5-methylaminomethyl-2-thiouridine)(34)-methyltransferase MnmD/FAD-dependent 5-carboxymethylaminomethyl-2-thiouridine(34) oxidoreductase MnmC [Gammaproteobacteria bacterium]|nr:MAG: bifunctional tRNA (5-methylaminomethyl-2-thiouridine)(34)-methyltransferase MnmD/FAD-dependent 5-carboxymethylaminomethyl-2-thiouridine(34) oxidoreductase MnmC [Gammaproteobacteria bacterium]
MDRSHRQPCLSCSTLFWDSTETPRSDHFDDIYYSRQNGKAETQHVFLHHNQLEERWQTLSADQNDFVIAETGFGTGLNFLCAWNLWRSIARTQGKTLHFVSFEKFPVAKADLVKAVQHWEDELCYETSRLLAQYPPPLKGIHRLNFDNSRIKLTLVFDDAIDGLTNHHFFADAWFLDGFAPDKNPEMWQEALLRQIALHSQKGTTLSTFTCVGRIRRGLIAQGFDVKKVKGFATKREMLAAKYCAGNKLDTASPDYFDKQHHWLNHRNPPLRVENTYSLPVIVVGGGLAGAWSAYSLAQRGVKVKLIEKNKAVALAASGNPQGILYCKPGREFTTQTQIGLHGCLYSSRELSRLNKQRSEATRIWSATGTALLAVNEKTHQDHHVILMKNNYTTDLIEPLDAKQVSAMSGTQVNYSALWLKHSGWVRPAELCRILCRHPNISVLTHTQVKYLDFNHDKQRWDLSCITEGSDNPTTLSSRVVILATGGDIRSLSQTRHFPIKTIKGQISRVNVADDKTNPLELVLCGEGYICPPIDNEYCFGATFDLHDDSPHISQSNHYKNMTYLRQLAPRLAKEVELASSENTDKPMQGRVGFRCATADYLPIVGPAPVYQDFLATFAALRTNAKTQFDCYAPYHPGLFVNIGHGSKGLATCPLAGEIIAGYLLGEPMPAQQSILAALHPSRFLIRGLKRNTL